MDSQDIQRKRFWAGAIIYSPRSGAVLMQKRDSKAPVNPNLWAFFGGTGEEGETPEICCVRELKEELGIHVRVDELLPFGDYFYEKIQTWRYVYILERDLQKSEMTLGEGENFDWVPLSDAPTYELTENTRKDLMSFIEHLRK